MNIKEVLQIGIKEINNLEDSSLKIRLLLSNILNVPKEYLIIHDDEEISSEKIEEFLKKVERLKKGEPIQYIINSQEFMGFKFYVDENVLIPQPDTEVLVENVVELSRKMNNSKLKILDMCTGSGAIAISLAKLIKNSEIIATDISKNALEIAKRNAINNNVKINFIESNLFETIPNQIKFDIIVSNPPYIKSNVIETLSREVKYEPLIALDGGKDGLIFYRKIAQNSKNFLNDNGYLIFEIGYDQKKEVEEILTKLEYENIYSKKDLGGNDRIVISQK